MKWVRNWRSATARSASGSAQNPPNLPRRPRATLAGFTRRATSCTSCPRVCKRKPRGACKTSGWPKPGRMPSCFIEQGRERLRLLPGSLRAEVRQGRGLPGQGPRRPADVLRLRTPVAHSIQVRRRTSRGHRITFAVRLRTLLGSSGAVSRNDGRCRHGLQYWMRVRRRLLRFGVTVNSMDRTTLRREHSRHCQIRRCARSNARIAPPHEPQPKTTRFDADNFYVDNSSPRHCEITVPPERAIA